MVRYMVQKRNFRISVQIGLNGERSKANEKLWETSRGVIVRHGK